MLTFKYVYTAVCGISLWFHENFDLVNILLRCLKNSPPVKRKYSMEYGKQTIEKAVPHKGFKKEMFFFNFALACRNRVGGNFSIPCDATRREYVLTQIFL